MALDPQIKSTLQQTIAVASASTRNEAGDLAYGAPANRLSRVELYSKRIVTADGEEKQTTHKILVELAIGENDRIWLPGDSSADAKLARLPLQIGVAVDENGALSHYEVTV